MPQVGPWTGPEVDRDFAKHSSWEPGDVVECKVYHDKPERPAGSIILVVRSRLDRARTYECTAIIAQDGYYDWWLFKSGEAENPGLYRAANGSTEDGDTKVHGRALTTIYEWRVLNVGGGAPDLKPIQWLSPSLKTRTLESVEVEMKDIEAPPKGSSAKDGHDRRSDAPELVRTPGLAAGEVAAGLAALREGLETAPLGPRIENKKPDEGRDRGRESNRSRTPIRRRRHSRARGDAVHLAEADDVKESFQSTQAGGKRSRRRRKHRSERHPDARVRSSDSERRERRRARSESRRSDSSSSSSLFRLASSSCGRQTQARLIKWSRDHPGRLASASLQRMQDRVGHEGEAAEWRSRDTPASAKSYYLRVLTHSAASGGIRNLREMKTLATVLDHLALGQSQSAADVVAQRLKSVELAATDGNWERGQFLELVEQDTTTLVSQDEKLMISRELELKQKTAKGRHENSYGKGWQNYDNVWQQGEWNSNKGQKGNSSSQKGSGKGKKGKKGKYNWWQTNSNQVAPTAPEAAAAAAAPSK